MGEITAFQKSRLSMDLIQQTRVFYTLARMVKIFLLIIIYFSNIQNAIFFLFAFDASKKFYGGPIVLFSIFYIIIGLIGFASSIFGNEFFRDPFFHRLYFFSIIVGFFAGIVYSSYSLFSYLLMFNGLILLNELESIQRKIFFSRTRDFEKDNISDIEAYYIEGIEKYLKDRWYWLLEVSIFLVIIDGIILAINAFVVVVPSIIISFILITVLLIFFYILLKLPR